MCMYLVLVLPLIISSVEEKRLKMIRLSSDTKWRVRKWTPASFILFIWIFAHWHSVCCGDQSMDRCGPWEDRLVCWSRYSHSTPDRLSRRDQRLRNGSIWRQVLCDWESNIYKRRVIIIFIHRVHSTTTLAQPGTAQHSTRPDTSEWRKGTTIWFHLAWRSTTKLSFLWKYLFKRLKENTNSGCNKTRPAVREYLQFGCEIDERE